MYEFKKRLSNRSNYGGIRSTGSIKFIVIHYTANDGDTDEGNGNYFANNIVKASAHYFVDDDSVTQSVPDGCVAWSVGGGKYANCSKTGGGKFYGKCTNTNSISIELCDDVRNGVVYPSAKTIENALILTKELMKKYGISKSNVIRHFDVVGKACPAYWCGNAANEAKWKSEFWNKLDGTIAPAPTEAKKQPSAASNAYTLTQFIKDVQKATGAEIDGIAGKETLSKTVTVSATVNSKHAIVKAIQKRLNDLGFDCGAVDGIAGAKFTAAVKGYQKANKCVADGEITAKNKTWKKLLGMA